MRYDDEEGRMWRFLVFLCTFLEATQAWVNKHHSEKSETLDLLFFT